MTGTIALPSRYVAHDSIPQHFDGYGGANGTIALPGRLDVLESGGPTDKFSTTAPPTDGAFGPRQPFMPVYSKTDRPMPHPIAAPTPYGWDATLYVRRFFDTFMTYLGRAMPAAATPDWTTNTVDTNNAIASPLPRMRAWRSYTLRQPFNSRVYSTYYPHEKAQSPADMAVYLQGQGYTMAKPYFPKLTEWQQSRSYSSTTQTVR